MTEKKKYWSIERKLSLLFVLIGTGFVFLFDNIIGLTGAIFSMAAHTYYYWRI